jgi:hypothetical protein
VSAEVEHLGDFFGDLQLRNAPNLSRRQALFGMSAMIAAPYVVRNSGLLMPVKDRTLLCASDLEWEAIFGTLQGFWS